MPAPRRRPPLTWPAHRSRDRAPFVRRHAADRAVADTRRHPARRSRRQRHAASCEVNGPGGKAGRASSCGTGPRNAGDRQRPDSRLPGVASPPPAPGQASRTFLEGPALAAASSQCLVLAAYLAPRIEDPPARPARLRIGRPAHDAQGIGAVSRRARHTELAARGRHARQYVCPRPPAAISQDRHSLRLAAQLPHANGRAGVAGQVAGRQRSGRVLRPAVPRRAGQAWVREEGKGMAWCEIAKAPEALIGEFMRGMDTALMPGGRLFLWMDKFHLCAGFPAWLAGTRLAIADLLTWDKGRIGMGHRTRCRCEYLVVSQQEPRRARGVRRIRAIPDAWAEAARRNGHTHERPVGLQGALIAAASNAGDVVIDPAPCRFPVMEACRSCDRNFLGCDARG